MMKIAPGQKQQLQNQLPHCPYRMWSWSVVLLFSFFLFGGPLPTVESTTPTTTTGSNSGNSNCVNDNQDDETGSCTTSDELVYQGKPVCGIDTRRCPYGHGETDKKSSWWSSSQPKPSTTTNTKPNIYQHGGTAHAYKPNVPLSSSETEATICDPQHYQNSPSSSSSSSSSSSFLFSWFPSTTKPAPSRQSPTLKISLNLWVCNTDPSKDCCCQPLQPFLEKEGLASVVTTVEAWQARPSGLYSSLRSKNDNDDDCRARMQTTTLKEDSGDKSPLFRLDTVLPGVVHSLSGLAPRSWMDWKWPLTTPHPPVIHFLISLTSSFLTNTLVQLPILVNLPLSVDPETLDLLETPAASSSSSNVLDWWFPKSPSRLSHIFGVVDNNALFPLRIASWKPLVEENSVDMTMDVFVSWDPSFESDEDPAVENNTTADQLLCQSLPFGFPASVFVEPISLCAPTLLDFFDL